MIRIQQNTPGTSGKARVTFSMPVVDDCERLYLIGWFSEWDETVYPMEQMPDGEWSITLELETGCTYEYRFRTLDGRWLSDAAGPAVSNRLGFNRSFIVSRSALAQSNTQPRSAPPS